MSQASLLIGKILFLLHCLNVTSNDHHTLSYSDSIILNLDVAKKVILNKEGTFVKSKCTSLCK